MPTDTDPQPGPAPAGPPAARGRAGKGYFLPGAIALAALLAISVFFVGAGDLAHPADTQLSGSDIAWQIALAVQAEGGGAHPPPVTCPAREPVRLGLRFRCALGGPSPRPLYVTEVDGRGRIRWSWSPA